MSQWTAGIRLSMFEHSSLQETYTGALIGGKGRGLNNIRTIMTHSKFQTSDWVRVRFGAGTPWRRCWCVITPPDEKEVVKAQKSMKKRSTYDRAQVTLKGDVNFYETKKITKKTQPIATISNAYAAYAIYPQSKPLIEQSTLIKIEGNVTIHTNPPTKLESFIFVMPEAHDAVTGFEMLVRFLFPIWDVFALYGRPQRLIPDTWNPKSLMFAMPKHDRWGYLDILDVTTLVTRPGSGNWSEAEWKRELKKLTADRIEKIAQDPNRSGSRPASQYGRTHRNSLPSRSGVLKFADDPTTDSRTSFTQERDSHDNVNLNNGLASQSVAPFSSAMSKGHGRSLSESVPNSPHRRAQDEYHLSRLSKESNRPGYNSDEDVLPPPPPAHMLPPALAYAEAEGSNAQHDSSGDEHKFHDTSESQTRAMDEQLDMNLMVDKPPSPVQPVAQPPAFLHQPGAKPQTRPYHSPELRRANSRMSNATLSQLAAATGKQRLGDGNFEADDQRLGRTNHAYNRSDSITDPNSDRSVQLSSSSPITSEQRFDSGILPNTANLQAPYQHINRSASPLRHVAAMTPVEEIQTPYFAENPFESQQSLQHTPFQPQHQPATPREVSMERPVSMGKISRKPVPPSPSSQPTDFIPSEQRFPSEIVLTRGIENAIVTRMDTIHSKASTASRRYSGDGSNYDSDSPGHELQPHPFIGQDLNRVIDRSSAAQPKFLGSNPTIQQSENWQVHDNHSVVSQDFQDTSFGPTPVYQPDLRTATQAADRLDSRKSTTHSPSLISNTQNRSPSRSPLPTPDSGYTSSGFNENRPFAWQSGPGVVSSGSSITPEQFVQQQAAANRVPVYSQASGPSGLDSRSYSWQNSGVPPLASAKSGDHVMSEHKSAASHLLHGGFDGGVEAREQDLMHGYDGHMNQQAAAQRQQQFHQYQEPMGPQYHIPGQFPVTPQFPTDWERSQQQEHPYSFSQNQAYGRPTHDGQIPPAYHEQENSALFQEDQRRIHDEGRSSGQSNPNHHAYRG